MLHALPDTFRTFFAVELTDELKAQVQETQHALSRARINLRWVRPENMHLTLLFVGDVTRQQGEALLSAMDEAVASAGPAFELTFAGLGAFPRLEQASVLWAGVVAGEAPLQRLHAQVRELTERAACPCDTRDYTPHLTLGRARDRRGLRLKLAQELIDRELGSMPVTRVALMRSELTPGGPEYTTMGTMRLTQAREDS